MKTRKIKIGKCEVGGNASISVQTMTNTKTSDVAATIAQIQNCEKAGCNIIRASIPDFESAKALENILPQIKIPLIADVHFDYRLAIAAIENGANGLRVNPSNITDKKNIEQIVAAAKMHQIPIRIGANSGSFKSSVTDKKISQELVNQIFSQCEILEKLNFFDIKVSVKSSNLLATTQAAKLFHQQCKKRTKNGIGDFYPQHIGITESGVIEDGIIKSAIGIGKILLDGIGDTIRVSLTTKPENEVAVGIKILEACQIRQPKIEIISCPTCARCNFDVEKTVRKIKNIIEVNCNLIPQNKKIKIAVMGCVVNGPGEARNADFAISGIGNSLAIFCNGMNIPSNIKNISQITEENLSVLFAKIFWK